MTDLGKALIAALEDPDSQIIHLSRNADGRWLVGFRKRRSWTHRTTARPAQTLLKILGEPMAGQDHPHLSRRNLEDLV